MALLVPVIKSNYSLYGASATSSQSGPGGYVTKVGGGYPVVARSNSNKTLGNGGKSSLTMAPNTLSQTPSSRVSEATKGGRYPINLFATHDKELQKRLTNEYYKNYYNHKSSSSSSSLSEGGTGASSTHLITTHPRGYSSSSSNNRYYSSHPSNGSTLPVPTKSGKVLANLNTLGGAASSVKTPTTVIFNLYPTHQLTQQQNVTARDPRITTLSLTDGRSTSTATKNLLTHRIPNNLLVNMNPALSSAALAAISTPAISGSRRYRSLSERSSSRVITPLPIIFENETLGSGPEMLFHPHTAPPVRRTRRRKTSKSSSNNAAHSKDKNTQQQGNNSKTQIKKGLDACSGGGVRQIRKSLRQRLLSTSSTTSTTTDNTDASSMKNTPKSPPASAPCSITVSGAKKWFSFLLPSSSSATPTDSLPPADTFKTETDILTADSSAKIELSSRKDTLCDNPPSALPATSTVIQSKPIDIRVVKREDHLNVRVGIELPESTPPSPPSSCSSPLSELDSGGASSSFTPSPPSPTTSAIPPLPLHVVPSSTTTDVPSTGANNNNNSLIDRERSSGLAKPPASELAMAGRYGFAQLRYNTKSCQKKRDRHALNLPLPKEATAFEQIKTTFDNPDKTDTSTINDNNSNNVCTTLFKTLSDKLLAVSSKRNEPTLSPQHTQPLSSFRLRYRGGGNKERTPLHGNSRLDYHSNDGGRSGSLEFGDETCSSPNSSSISAISSPSNSRESMADEDVHSNYSSSLDSLPDSSYSTSQVATRAETSISSAYQAIHHGPPIPTINLNDLTLTNPNNPNTYNNATPLLLADLFNAPPPSTFTNTLTSDPDGTLDTASISTLGAVTHRSSNASTASSTSSYKSALQDQPIPSTASATSLEFFTSTNSLHDPLRSLPTLHQRPDETKCMVRSVPSLSSYPTSLPLAANGSSGDKTPQKSTLAKGATSPTSKLINKFPFFRLSRATPRVRTISS